MDWTAYDIATGRIVAQMQGSEEFVSLNLLPGQAAVPGRYPGETHFIREGVALAYPPRPGPWAEWDGAAWIDPRMPVDRDAELAAWRATASMTRANLVIAAVGAGIIPQTDAAPAARGEITPSIQALIDQMPANQQLEAVVRWAASTVIERNNPILTTLARSMGLTDEQLDQLFGAPPSA